ncbi:MAG: ABC transporter permease [Acidobacteria bacterium]|nr:ABC transporter permease [Acidobacteriota bacterium]
MTGPVGILLRTILLGVVTGSVYALASTGLVLTYKASGVLNFGYGAVAMFTAFVHWQLAAGWGLPVWLSAMIVVLVVAPLLGLLLDTHLFSRIQSQPMVIAVIATVGLTVLLQGIVFLVWGAESHRVPSMFPRAAVPLPGGAAIGADQVAIFVVAAGAAGLLAAMFRFTRLGVSFRAVVDNRPVAGLMGIDTGRVSGVAWALGTSFAALTGILLTPETLLDPNFLPFLVISNVLGAAIVGYLRSLPLAYAGGLLVGILQSIIIQYGRPQGFLVNLKDAVPFLIVVGAVLAAPKALRLAGLGASFVVRTREVAGAASPRARAPVATAVFGGLALVPLLAAGSPSWVISVTRGMVMGIVFLSLVILTGYSGQISLGHTAFMGISAFTAAHLAADLGVPVGIAAVAGALAAVPAGAAIGAIAVRLHGLFLALMTLGLAYVAQTMFFDNTSISRGLSGFPLPRPPGTSGDRPFFYIVLLALAAAALLASNLRTGRTGRVLAAMRDSETASRALGINVFKYKVVIFALSALMAGAGAILASMQTGTIGQRDFYPFLSLFLVTIAVVGGIFHVGGAIVSGMLFGLYPQVFGNVEIMGRLQYLLFGMGATLALARNPEGLFGELRRAGVALLAATARRRRPRAGPVPVAGGRE